MMRQWIACATLALVAVPAAAMELAGVTLPDEIAVGGTTLKLNGMGLRTKTMLKVKVYAAGLYLATPSHDAAAIVAAEEPKQVVMHFLYKKVEKDKLTVAWREGFANNSAAALAALKVRLDEFCALWPDMASGERAVITYLPAPAPGWSSTAGGGGDYRKGLRRRVVRRLARVKPADAG
jgi:hypothetical protein